MIPANDYKGIVDEASKLAIRINQMYHASQATGIGTELQDVLRAMGTALALVVGGWEADKALLLAADGNPDAIVAALEGCDAAVRAAEGIPPKFQMPPDITL
ncbi:hypothetical protein Wildcat_54 [Mycobacterium phage Wildcat]|uniref:Uncharacterized protein n=4 Tax=Mycobacterium virus Wildcat TaxID=1993859 RepID=Q19Y06_9CAUD|nr:hypothetical protein Wildcat_54 [Mycobacterium phage Wildcat]AJD82126.1 hypothetical protein COSMO_54 [Mycobacterium phage Cosmo]AQT25726.1 hypothetical protein EniyanLRS_51 [Mycobacterium phage EniyanLRS]QGJ89944.1 hypothetical protein PBI_MARYV_54 [Mycobacterium phage MaryV]WKR36064.1 hypothetical protein [Mycobacterium phage Azrael100]ABE67659.1 hypothetical protein Wildcat_54 [Mycobacterium phage Wildcat]